MPTDDRKKNVTARAATLIIFSACFIGLCVLAAYEVARFEYKKQLAGRDLQIEALRKSQEVLAGRNVELLNSLRKMENEYGKPCAMKAEANPGPVKREGHESREQTAPVLGSTWISAGEVISLFDGKLRIVFNQASAGDMCRKGSVVGHINRGGPGREKVCLGTGAPAKFIYRGGSYTLKLSGLTGRGNVYHYFISISH